jgi:hypothetical protein
MTKMTQAIVGAGGFITLAFIYISLHGQNEVKSEVKIENIKQEIQEKDHDQRQAALMNNLDTQIVVKKSGDLRSELEVEQARLKELNSFDDVFLDAAEETLNDTEGEPKKFDLHKDPSVDSRLK